jgi:hypothetical protein
MLHPVYDFYAFWNKFRRIRLGQISLLNSSYRTICFSSLDGPKLHTRKPDQSSRNRHSPQTSVRELSLHPQPPQFHNEPREHVQTRITLTYNTTRGLSQRHHLARAALGRSSAQGALNRSSRGDGRGGDLWVGWIDYNLFSVS